MENRTLLTVVGLLLAGIVTIMLARAGADSSTVDIFNRADNNHRVEESHTDMQVRTAPEMQSRMY